MLTIYKYPLGEPRDIIQFEMPANAEILCIQTQRGTPCIWAKVETNNQLENRIFQTIGTGHPIDDDAPREHIGTYQLSGGALVFHVFELI